MARLYGLITLGRREGTRDRIGVFFWRGEGGLALHHLEFMRTDLIKIFGKKN